MPILLILGILAVGVLLGAMDRAWMRRRHDNRIRHHAPWIYGEGKR